MQFVALWGKGAVKFIEVEDHECLTSEDLVLRTGPAVDPQPPWDRKQPGNMVINQGIIPRKRRKKLNTSPNKRNGNCLLGASIAEIELDRY